MGLRRIFLFISGGGILFSFSFVLLTSMTNNSHFIDTSDLALDPELQACDIRLSEPERDWISQCEHTSPLEESLDSPENHAESHEEQPAVVSETYMETFIREFEEQCSWQRIARSIANKYGMAHYRSFVFTDTRINDVYYHILGFGVALMKKKFDPSRGVKETTFLYKIMTCLAIDEYRRIVRTWRRRREDEYSEELQEHEFWAEEFGESCNWLATVDRDDTFRRYSTVTDEEIQSVKRQYLPVSLRDLPEKELQRRLSEIDRQIVDRLSEGDALSDVRNEFESLPENGGGAVDHRQFFESRRLGIIRRGNLKEPKSWSRRNTPMVLFDASEDFDWDDPDARANAVKKVVWPAAVF